MTDTETGPGPTHPPKARGLLARRRDDALDPTLGNSKGGGRRVPSYKTSLTGIIQKGCYALALTALMAAASACGGQEPASPEGQQPVEEQQAAQRPFPTITLPPTPLPPELPETRTPEAPGAQLTPQPGRDNPPISTPTPPPEDEGTIVGIAVGYAQHVPGRRYPVLQVRPGQVLKLRAYARYEDGTYSPIPKDPLRIPIFSLKQTSRIRLYPGNILQVLAPVRTRITLSWDDMVQTVEVQADPEPSQTADRLTGIAVHPAGLTLRAQGETQILRATGIFDDGSTGPVPLLPRAKITFSSTDPDVADVSRDGVLTALYTGETFVTVHFGPHSTRTPTHALVLIQEEDSNVPDPECLYPHPDQDGMSASANRLKVTLYPEHDTQQTATDVAARLGGASTGQDRTLSVHFIEFPCPQVPEEQRAQALNELALLLMEQPEVEFIEQMTLRTPAPEPTPSGAPDLQAPTAPESAGDLTVRTDTDPNHIRLQPGERWKLQGIILHQTNRSREELPLDAVGLTFEIAPIGDENPAAPYLNLVTVDENGVISADRRAPTSSFTVVASYLGHTAHLRVDIRGGDEPGRMNAFDCTKPGSTGDLMIEFRPNADAADKEAVTQDLRGITRHDYPAFNGRVAEVPCGSPADMTQAVAAALERREVTDAYPYIPTPGDASHELWQPALTPEQKHMTLEVGETRLIEPTHRPVEHRQPPAPERGGKKLHPLPGCRRPHRSLRRPLDRGRDRPHTRVRHSRSGLLPKGTPRHGPPHCRPQAAGGNQTGSNTAPPKHQDQGRTSPPKTRGIRTNQHMGYLRRRAGVTSPT